MFKSVIFSAALVFMLSLFNAKMLTVRKNHDPGSCSESNHGELKLVKDRENRDTILVCTEFDEVFSWKTTDNSKPPGEYFNPGYDCLDILNKNPKSKDGFYWVNFNAGKPKKVYCDMTTDGGGYILFGYINGTVTWGVPSNNETVQPFGDPRWSSEFGDVSVLDFRIQVASDNDMKETKAHWAFRFKTKRVLKNLMIVDQGGCPNNFPGIGDVSYVKDLMTGEIVSKDFPCSIFGPYSYPTAKIGWTMMNLCLEKPCPNGFAYHPLIPIQLDFSGGFSYISLTNSSTSSGGSTAFFGCEKSKCCACYGPRGGRNVYCLEECQATNGGTITKHASAWFWVRSNPPRKVWEKCMEYKSEEESGDSAWYKLEGDRNIPVKGRCGKSEALMNDGVLLIEDGNNLKDVPAVSGLLVYRKDDHSVNVRSNETWEPLVKDKKVSDIDKRLSRLTQLVKNMHFGYLPSCSTLKEKHAEFSSGIYSINPRSRELPPFPVYCDMSAKQGVGVTEFGHDSETRTKVSGFENAGSYRRNVTYYNKMSDIVAVISVSKNCEQFIRYECHYTYLKPNSYGWWVSRQGKKMNYWGGAAIDSGKCACGMTNSCEKNKMCNCDAILRELREDSGYLTDRKTLPVTELRFGDTGADGEYGFHTLGKLRCWG
ncbi:uncharacterized protein LOC114526145 [Dendronephthya gigantea]|uniref:uncharacterized protein LOC114526145 n=1 Tax=Dendronephthya gigantea TaxID=151771 RepID=UPI00106C6CEC|nr:uncharacterized protein LOC114526145 [Dendronephthya gigantea]